VPRGAAQRGSARGIVLDGPDLQHADQGKRIWKLIMPAMLATTGHADRPMTRTQSGPPDASTGLGPRTNYLKAARQRRRGVFSDEPPQGGNKRRPAASTMEWEHEETCSVIG
jgi:hypothetical protein